MTSIELLVVLLLLTMAMPDVCKWLGRPALTYPGYVCFGVLAGSLIRPEVANMIREAGQIGFVLLLFQVGLDIELPAWRKLRKPGLYVLRWVLPQYPLLLLLCHFSGLSWLEAMTASAALTACAVGMAHGAWSAYPGLDAETRPQILQVMVLLEMVAVVLLAVETSAMGDFSPWLMALKIVGMALAIYGCSRLGKHMTALLQTILERTTHWRLHFVTLLILVVCALGERLGLSGPKTAFFLGLFSSRVRHDGRSLDEYLAPISRQFLIPLFFTGLGTQIPLESMFSHTVILALVAAVSLIVFRHVLHLRFAPTGGDAGAHLLFSPCFTMVAMAASSLFHAGADAQVTIWLLLTGLFVTLIAVLALPPIKGELAEGGH